MYTYTLLVVRIDCSHEGTVTPEQQAALLRKVADKVEAYGGGVIVDENGNTVGYAGYEEVTV